ncbi:MAG: hypothetical protein ABI635_09885, partial [Actinomycetota bacterium]
GTLLASGDPLPAGCVPHRTTASQSVAFAAEGRIWALDPTGGRLSCVLQSTSPGPFLWGPQGDRVLLGDFQIAGIARTPSYDANVPDPAIAAWGRPLGIAIVYAASDATHPQKLFLQDDSVETLHDMPRGTYLDIAYHPSGLALASIIEQRGTQSIWFSTNEGTDAKRLVFTKTGTTFSDVGFTNSGRSLVYVAHHAEGYSEVHTIDLSRPDELISVWKGRVGRYVRSVWLSPDDTVYAATEGTACADSRAVLLGEGSRARPALPHDHRPTAVLGWLDQGTVLVGAGGCGAPMDLFSVAVGGDTKPAPLATGVDTAASRAPAPPAPTSIPKEVELATGSGKG